VFYRYRVHNTDRNDIGMAHYAVLIRPGEEIIIGKGVGVPVGCVKLVRPASPRFPRTRSNLGTPYA
jgi:hypothetical protein